MPPSYINELREEVGEYDVKRGFKLLDPFNWEIIAIMGPKKAEFVSFMRDKYEYTTRRQYCSCLTHIFESKVVQGLYDNVLEHEEALLSWKNMKTAINAQDKKLKGVWQQPVTSHTTEICTEQEEFINETKKCLEALPSDVSDPIYKELYLLSDKALDMVHRGNSIKAVHYLLHHFLAARICNHKQCSAPFSESQALQLLA